MARISRRRIVIAAAVVPAAVVVVVAIWLAIAFAVYPHEYVWRVIAWRESDVGDYLHHFPHRTLTAAARPFVFEHALEERRVADTFQSVLGVDDFGTFLTGTHTQAFIVIQDDKIVYESYFNGWQRDSMLTSFSVAKSFTSTLVGTAIDRGEIRSLDDPIARYLPELLERDPRFGQITIRHLLTMSSGLAFQSDRWALFNGDDPLTTYYPDQRYIALHNTHIADPPGESFLYNKYHPQLLGLILERATGMSVTELTQSRLWGPLGMEFDGQWCLDSTGSGFEKMEAGLNARAIDYAKLGRLFLRSGDWNGEQIVSSQWVALASGADPTGRAPAFADDAFYGLMWWGIPRASGPPDFTAEGDHGQFIYVSPAHHMIIVRNGVEYGIPSQDWLDAFKRFAERF